MEEIVKGDSPKISDSRYAKQVSPIMTLNTDSKASVIEVSCHELRPAFLREMEGVLPSTDIPGLLAIATMQRSKHDLVQIGENIEIEKDRCLENFMSFARALCDLIVKVPLTAQPIEEDPNISKFYFADFIDPCSGLAMLHQESQKVFSEVDSAIQLLGYATQNCGCCKVLLHPNWGSAVYPATIFTNLPYHLLTSEFMQKAVSNMKPLE
jgi:hypothetical protein